MGIFSYMQVFCPICRNEFDGMKGIGRETRCCCGDCHQEWEWRKTLAILGKQYYPNPHRMADATISGSAQ